VAWRRVGERGRSFGGGACFPGPCSPIVPLAALSRWLTVLPSSSPGHCGYSTPSLVARRRRRVTSFAFLRGARQRARLPTVQTTPPLAPGALYGAFAPQAATRTPTASSACGSVRLPPAARKPVRVRRRLPPAARRSPNAARLSTPSRERLVLFGALAYCVELTSSSVYATEWIWAAHAAAQRRAPRHRLAHLRSRPRQRSRMSQSTSCPVDRSHVNVNTTHPM